jgi:predicted dehydrogenase
MTVRITRRAALKGLAGAGLAAPLVLQATQAAQVDTLNHASFGASGMAIEDIRSLTASKHLRLVAVADVDLSRTAQVQKQFPKARIYQDWRQLLDKEKDLQSANVSTPDHMHAPITMRCIEQGLHVYTQKPLTQTIYEARQLTTAARDRKIVSQMGIQIHSHQVHRTVVATLEAGAIGKVREVHSWSNKQWGDRKPRPQGMDKVPANLNWDHWLGVAAERPYLAKYYHPGQWRKRLDFGTGTFGDMGCHILDPVFAGLALTAPRSVRADSGSVGADSWGLDCRVQYVFPGTKLTVESLTLFWYDGTMRPPEKVMKLIGNQKPADQGSIYIGTDGVLYSPYIAAPVLLPAERFKGYKFPQPGGQNHYLQFVEACRGNGRTSTPFDYSGPLTEAVLLGCLATRFQKQTLEWNAAKLQITNVKAAQEFVRKTYRKGWEVKGL